jgi:hypothetical protein
MASRRGVAAVDGDLDEYPAELCRPYGTQAETHAYPALKRWANIYRTHGAEFLRRVNGGVLLRLFPLPNPFIVDGSCTPPD